jgi:phosphoribosylformylglycinamidine synthase
MNPNYGKIDPYWMAASAIDEAIRNNVSVGGGRIALLDNFTWGSPEKSDRVGGLLRACKACYDFAKAYGTPFISGKDSLYNESPLGPVTPTLLITAVGVIKDIRKAVSIDVKMPGNLLYLAGRTYPELGGSEYYRLKGYIGKTIPKVRIEQADTLLKAISKAIRAGYVKACHDLSEGGLAVTAAEMALSGDSGISLSLRSALKSKDTRRNDHILFSESNSRFLVEVEEKHKADFEGIMERTHCVPIGRVEKDNYLTIHGLDGATIIEASLVELRRAWKSVWR